MLYIAAVVVLTAAHAVLLLQTPQVSTSTRPAQVKREVSTGDYLVTYLKNGKPETFRIVPATKIAPRIRTTVTALSEGYFDYVYSVSNGSSALQDLHAISFSVAHVPGTRIEQPTGWKSIRTPETNKLSWLKTPTGRALDGIAAGSELGGFRVVTPLLPGPTEVRCSGATEPLSIPLDVPPEIVRYLNETLLLRNNVITWALTPSIPPGLNEPELTAGVLVSRVHAAYFLGLNRTVHPAREQILAALTEAANVMDKEHQAGNDALDRAYGLALQTTYDDWSNSIGKSLALCIEYIKRRFAF